MNLPITVGILAQNEGPALRRLLPELGWACEVLVVDGGSRDQTSAVASQHGAHVLQRPFDTFAAGRNAALENAENDWVLFVDADERPTSSFVKSCAGALARPRHQAYRVRIKSEIFGRRFRYSGTQDDKPIRMVHRRHVTYSGAVHERALVQGSVGHLDGQFEHVTLPDLHSFLAKMSHYTYLEVQERLRLGIAPARLAGLWAPPRELFRRLVWKLGILDGPRGWAFCSCSALSEWVLARRHREAWSLARAAETSTQTSVAKRRCGEGQALSRSTTDNFMAAAPQEAIAGRCPP